MYFLWQRLLEAKLDVVVTIPEDPALRRAWLEGSPLHSVRAEAEVAKLVRALEERRGAFAEAPLPPAVASSISP